jgi:hypothetical protein
VRPEHLMLASAAIVGALGTTHLLLTYVGPKLLPRDRALRDAMEHVPLVITRQTTMWRAWIGFNASHSLGAMLFGLVYGYLAAAHAGMLFGSSYLLVVGAALLLAYVMLARRYWFSTPLAGSALSFALYLASVAWWRAG